MSLCVICEKRIATVFQIGFKTIRSDVCRTCNTKLQHYCQLDQTMKVQELKERIKKLIDNKNCYCVGESFYTCGCYDTQFSEIEEQIDGVFGDVLGLVFIK